MINYLIVTIALLIFGYRLWWVMNYKYTAVNCIWTANKMPRSAEYTLPKDLLNTTKLGASLTTVPTIWVSVHELETSLQYYHGGFNKFSAYGEVLTKQFSADVFKQVYAKYLVTLEKHSKDERFSLTLTVNNKFIIVRQYNVLNPRFDIDDDLTFDTIVAHALHDPSKWLKQGIMAITDLVPGKAKFFTRGNIDVERLAQMAAVELQKIVNS